MKAIQLSARTDIDEITPRTKAIAFSFRPNMKDFLNMINKGRSIKTMFVPPSTMKSIGPSAKKLLDTMGVELKETPEDMRGQRTDINGHEVDISVKEEE